MMPQICRFYFFFFNDTATTEIYTLSLHDALPIFPRDVMARIASVEADDAHGLRLMEMGLVPGTPVHQSQPVRDRKSTRLNSSHGYISYAVFCLKKKTKHTRPPPRYCHRRLQTPLT